MVPTREFKRGMTTVIVGATRDMQAALVAAAKRERDRVLAEQTARAGGIAPTWVQVVDGRRNAPLETVRHDGVVVFQWNYMREIALRAAEFMRRFGPDGPPDETGDWPTSVRVYADDVEVDPRDPRSIPHGTAYVEVQPTVIYARRLEVVTGFVVNEPGSHFLAGLAQDLHAEYRHVARVALTFTERDGGHVLPARPGHRDRRRRAATAMRYPAIQIRRVRG